MNKEPKHVEAPVSAAPGRLDFLWNLLARPMTAGVLLFFIGLILVATVLTAMPPQVPSSWWTVAFRSAEALRSFASLGALALGAGLVLLVERVRAMLGANAASAPDRLLDEPPQGGTGAETGLLRFAPLVGVVLMVAGVVTGVGSWAASQRDMPPSRLTVPTQRKIETYPAVTATSSVKVMLPSRGYVRTINVDEQTAAVEFLQVGEEKGEGRMQTLGSFDPVEIDGFRWSMLGVEYSDAVLSAVVEPSGEGAIPAQGAVGDTLQFEIDGPEYKVMQITRNYLGVLGPAVELDHPDEGRFWVFERAQDPKVAPRFEHGLRLRQIERAPVAIISVAPAPSQDLLPVAGILFIVGLALFLFFPDLVVRERDDGWAVSSLNEAGDLGLGGDDE